MIGGSALIIRLRRRVLLDAVQWRDMFVGHCIHYYAVGINHRKSMWAADEKLMINEWGLMLVLTLCQTVG